MEWLESSSVSHVSSRGVISYKLANILRNQQWAMIDIPLNAAENGSLLVPLVLDIKAANAKMKSDESVCHMVPMCTFAKRVSN
jgi:hypothetical protein